MRYELKDHEYNYFEEKYSVPDVTAPTLEDAGLQS